MEMPLFLFDFRKNSFRTGVLYDIIILILKDLEVTHVKRKCQTLFVIMIVTFLFTGCGNIKFIERVEPEKTEENTEEHFGDIIIDEVSEEPSEKSSEEESVEQPSETTEEFQEPSIDDNVEIHNGIEFVKGTVSTMYVTEGCFAKVSPYENARNCGELYRGDIIEVRGVSTDEKWAKIVSDNGESVYVQYKYLQVEEIEPPKSTVNELNTEESGENSESTEKPTESAEQTEQSSENTTEQPSQSVEQPSYEEPSSSYVEPEPEPEPEPDPVDTYQGIAFPSNASSVSYNSGVEFADVTITLRVRSDAVVSNGPATPSFSSGYDGIGTLSQGSSVKCTGIGRNGFVRIDYNGYVGFVDGRYVEY